jgi:hypothetical protein
MKYYRSLTLAALLAAGLMARPVPASAQPDLDHIRVTYHGGALLRRARVITLFWGPDWSQSALRTYYNNFFQALFRDGRFMANLSQYGTAEAAIENGVFGGTCIDPTAPAAQLSDAQIQDEFRSRIAAGNLPPPDENTVYFVFTPPGVVVTDPTGADSQTDISGYHNSAGGDTDFPYAVIPNDPHYQDPRFTTLTISHELAEAVTNPRPSAAKTSAWFDENNGEIGDIPIALFEAGRIKQDDLVDVLRPGPRVAYLVQKEWSVKDSAPVAFAVAGG